MGPVWDPGTSQQGEVWKNIKGPLRYLHKWYILYQIRGADRKRRSSVASVLSCSCLLSSLSFLLLLSVFFSSSFSPEIVLKGCTGLYLKQTKNLLLLLFVLVVVVVVVVEGVVVL